jgi:hypothetical protein
MTARWSRSGAAAAAADAEVEDCVLEEAPAALRDGPAPSIVSRGARGKPTHAQAQQPSARARVCNSIQATVDAGEVGLEFIECECDGTTSNRIAQTDGEERASGAKKTRRAAVDGGNAERARAPGREAHVAAADVVPARAQIPRPSSL